MESKVKEITRLQDTAAHAFAQLVFQTETTEGLIATVHAISIGLGTYIKLQSNVDDPEGVSDDIRTIVYNQLVKDS